MMCNLPPHRKCDGDERCTIDTINAVYATARDATTANSNETYLYIGQNGPATNDILRMFSSFAIPDMGTLTSASLFLYGINDLSNVDFEIYFLTSTYSNPLVADDYDLLMGIKQAGIHWHCLNNAWNSSSWL